MTLTQEQLAAIQTFAQGTVFVKAGAGTGKTTVLVERIAWLVRANGTDPRRIAAVTYTLNAAAELRRRLQAIDIEVGFVGTIHALALHVLKQAQPDKKFVVLSPEEDAELLKAAAKHVGYKWTMAQLFAIVGGVSTNRPSAMAAFLDYLRRKGDRLTFYHLIEKAKNCADINDLFDTILLDEYQDVTEQTWNLVRLVSPSRFCIGDPAQAVFSFNGGGFLTGHLGQVKHGIGTTFTLSQTQRCATRICEVANQVMRGPGYIPLRSSIQHGVVTVQEHADAKEEREYIVACVAAHRPDQSIGILARTRFVAQSLQGALDQWEFRDRENGPPLTSILKLLRFLETPEDDALAMSFLLRTRSEAEADRLELEAAQHFQSINQYCLQVPAYVTARDAASFVDRALEFESGLVEIAKDLPESATVSDFILALSEPLPVAQCSRYLGTIHGAKGLEFDTVVVVGCEDGLLPLNGQDAAEERRLLYVALTRARTRVVLSWCRERALNEWSKPTAQKLSRFLEGLK